jgi:hypothetical protein
MRRPTAVLHFTVAASLLAFPASCPAAIPDLAWQALQPGVDYTVITSHTAGRGLGGDERLHVVRIDPGRAPLVAAMASAGDRKPRTAAEWCRERGLAVAINLGMYREDKLTNVGHAHVPGHNDNASWSKSYKSALGFVPGKQAPPAALLVDLDMSDARERLAPYGAVVQNLRLMRAGTERLGQAGPPLERSGRGHGQARPRALHLQPPPLCHAGAQREAARPAARHHPRHAR